MRRPLKREALSLLRARGVPVATVLDVGVQHGTPELIEAFPDKTHILFEPVASYEPQISKAYANVRHRIVSAAVSDAVGSVELMTASVVPGMEVSHAWMAPESERGKGHPLVPMITLDSYVCQHKPDEPFFLKIDVDGYEPWVLRGATETLKRSSVVMIEAPHDVLAERLTQLSGAGFRLFDLSEPCYFDGALAQVDAIFVPNDIFGRCFKDIRTQFAFNRYEMFTG